jgi:hypothetical protein
MPIDLETLAAGDAAALAAFYQAHLALRDGIREASLVEGRSLAEIGRLTGCTVPEIVSALSGGSGDLARVVGLHRSEF